jgi:hypothetical protein
MTNEPAPETDAKLASDPCPPSDWPAFASALEIQRDALRAAFDLSPDERIPAQTPRPGSLLVETGSIRRRVSFDERDDSELVAAQGRVRAALDGSPRSPREMTQGDFFPHMPRRLTHAEILAGFAELLRAVEAMEFWEPWP